MLLCVFVGIFVVGLFALVFWGEEGFSELMNV